MLTTVYLSFYHMPHSPLSIIHILFYTVQFTLVFILFLAPFFELFFTVFFWFLSWSLHCSIIWGLSSKVQLKHWQLICKYNVTFCFKEICKLETSDLLLLREWWYPVRNSPSALKHCCGRQNELFVPQWKRLGQIHQTDAFAPVGELCWKYSWCTPIQKVIL